MKFIKNILASIFSPSKEKPPSPIARWKRQRSIIGKTGKTLTHLGLTGLIEIDGKEFEAESKSGYIKMNMPIRIVGKHMSWFLVEAI